MFGQLILLVFFFFMFGLFFILLKLIIWSIIQFFCYSLKNRIILWLFLGALFIYLSSGTAYLLASIFGRHCVSGVWKRVKDEWIVVSLGKDEMLKSRSKWGKNKNNFLWLIIKNIIEDST